jgi:hypothetical protein
MNRKESEMDLRNYCVKLKYYRDKGVRFNTFYGKPWFVSRLLGILVSVYFLNLNILGYFFMGFISGSVAIEVRTFIKTQRYWPFQKEIINWDKVEELAENKLQN